MLVEFGAAFGNRSTDSMYLLAFICLFISPPFIRSVKQTACSDKLDYVESRFSDPNLQVLTLLVAPSSSISVTAHVLVSASTSFATLSALR